MRRIRGWPLALLLLAGCQQGPDLDYGSTTGSSLNGIALLDRHLERELDAERLFLLSKRLDDYQTVVHVDTEGDALASLGEDDWDVLMRWLLDEDRQLVVFLRDGEVGNWLLERWIEEAQQQMARADPEQRRRLQEVVKRLYRNRTSPPPPLGGADSLEFLDVELTATAAHRVRRIEGLVDCPAPPFLTIGSHLRRAGPLLRADGEIIAGYTSYFGSRVVLITTTTPFLDAALVDRRARRMLYALIGDIRGHATGRVARLASLRVPPDQVPPPSILGMLFGTFPFNIVALQVVALLLCYVWYRGYWLGRGDAQRDRRREHFAQHLTALAGRLRSQRAWNRCLRAIAGQWQADEPPPVASAEGAVDTVRTMLYATTPPPREESHADTP